RSWSRWTPSRKATGSGQGTAGPTARQPRDASSMSRAGRTQASSTRPARPSGGALAGVSPLTARARRRMCTLGMDMPDKVALDMKQRLALLRGTASTLDQQRRAALAEMRQSLEAIRQLSDTLAQLRQQSSSDPRKIRDRGALALADRYGLSL